ncbi:hypothetical protein E4T66_17915 [Sinimarinibacterium sp. CAU 1509]|uniref:hypothetical protein n=1 Tax=Sinimarinibacterium sp. CAU 1509 TaxID=2562283 RepID=UPI0010AC2965|nr:hypothetical protein [Sinimarinibacterium sp. CAU 1509]TJY57282.1 hypothetical protein E4T66_17915 [Sinimarinibacterium sp. CAU 1509]
MATLKALPRQIFRRKAVDLRAKEEVFVRLVLVGLLGLKCVEDVLRHRSVIEGLVAFAPEIITKMAQVGATPHVMRCSTRATPTSYGRQSAEAYEADLRVILDRLVPMYQSRFVSADDSYAAEQITAAVLRISPWLMERTVNPLTFVRECLTGCMHPEELNLVPQWRLKAEFRGCSGEVPLEVWQRREALFNFELKASSVSH